ncbi:UDP-N-acetylglucosamine 2-epimerase [Qipengyuania oceanensis]|uniref:UDP-N-acetylglucosamine 2-epimerase (Hydrolyzing) n=1 Tax=Qipengyuania oceanensis TaxID=1463597 RepID=A0A844YG32_9SPHN|nr:UDP-N-acetylglucosamine 2-epimerase (hydrolyzing) [Qipengyuania oceanensis]
MIAAKKLTYLTGTRADFGVMLPILRALDASDAIDLDLLVTGMHMSEKFGHTLNEVEGSGLRIASAFSCWIDEDSGPGMARSVAEVTRAVADFLEAHPRDGLILLGDRGEMLAGATAALFCGVPILHIAGGEVSGSVDDSIRHAISKLAHVHLVAAEDGRQRLLGLGEEAERIHLVGAPGLPGLKQLASVPLQALADRYGFSAQSDYVLLLFHPVVQDAMSAGRQFRVVLDALRERNLQIVALLPNADHGTGHIRNEIDRASELGQVFRVTHMPREDYLSVMRNARFLIGNSSSGIVEAATLETAVVNIGDRQAGRLRGPNVFDAELEPASIDRAIDAAMTFDTRGLENVYGTDEADRNIRHVIENIDLADTRLLKKAMTY